MAVTLLSEGFEGDFPSDNGWSVGDSNGTGTSAYWDDVDSSFGGEGTHGGSWKGYCADIGNAGTSSAPRYRDSMNAFMSRSINLSNLSSANLSFWYKIPSIESGNYDHLRVFVDSARVFDTSVVATSWTQATVNLTPYLGGNRALKFEFYSDSTGTAEGAYLDDIIVTGEQNTPPPNNSFANRIPIAGMAPTAVGTNVNATKEAGEPNHAGNSGGKSVWWTWTAPASGPVQIDTIGSTFDTILGVYTGSSVSSLSYKASNDDGGGNGISKVIFDAVAGTAYQIAVDGYNGASGNITLHVIPQVIPPPNNNLSNRTLISGTSPTAAGTNVNATKEAGEPNHAGNPGGKSVWWTWTAPASGRVQIDTIGSNFNTILGVYTGSSVSSLSHKASNNDSGGNVASLVTFDAVAGTAYQIAVDGYNGVSGNITLHVLPVGPPNNNFANRAPLAGTAPTAAGTNVNATKEAGEPNHAGNLGGKSVWWTWTAPASGRVQIDTIGSSYDTTLGVYTGSIVSSLTHVASNDDSGGTTTSLVTFDAVAGRTYQIAVDGYNAASGNITLHVNLVPRDQYENDNIASLASRITTDRTVQTHSISPVGDEDWVAFTLTQISNVFVETNGSSGDTAIWLYGPNSSTTLVEYDNDDGNGAFSRIDRNGSNALGAGTYYVRISEYGNDSTIGNYSVSVGGAEVYRLWEHWGGNWSDAEKTIANTDDDLMCWAAAASNILAWTRWGNVGGMSGTDQIFSYFQNHWTDEVGLPEVAWDWWFDGTNKMQGTNGWSQVDVPGGGFFTNKVFSNYFHSETADSQAMNVISRFLRAGYGTSLSLRGTGAHEVTCWGIDYDPANPTTVHGLWVTDSDDGISNEPTDRLAYYTVTLSNGQWYLDSFAGSTGWFVDSVWGLDRMPSTSAGGEASAVSITTQLARQPATPAVALVTRAAGVVHGSANMGDYAALPSGPPNLPEAVDRLLAFEQRAVDNDDPASVYGDVASLLAHVVPSEVEHYRWGAEHLPTHRPATRGSTGGSWLASDVPCELDTAFADHCSADVCWSARGGRGARVS